MLRIYLTGHTPFPSALLSKVSREPLHLLAQIIPVAFGAGRLWHLRKPLQ
jgi:hypothetical protein